jgi:hypothetical protein
MKTYAHMLVTRVFLGIAEGGTLVIVSFDTLTTLAGERLLVDVDRPDLFIPWLG